MGVLAADNALLALLEGGVWDRPLLKAPDVGATPEAFSDRTGEAGRLLPSAVVQTGGVGVSFAGNTLVASLGGVNLGASRAVTVWLYEPRPGRAAIEAAKFRVIELLHRRAVATDGEGRCVLAFIGDLGDGVVDEDLDASVEQVRFRAGTMIGRG